MTAFIEEGCGSRNDSSSLKFLSSENLQNIYDLDSSPNVATDGKIIFHFRDEENEAKEEDWPDGLKGRE